MEGEWGAVGARHRFLQWYFFCVVQLITHLGFVKSNLWIDISRDSIKARLFGCAPCSPSRFPRLIDNCSTPAGMAALPSQATYNATYSNLRF